MPEEELAAESLPSFQSTLEHALKTLLDDIGVSRKVHMVQTVTSQLSLLNSHATFALV